VHRPGEAAQTDFTNATALGVTIASLALAHLLCVFVLPYSNWQWATVCLPESIAALRKGVQRALFQLGGVPRYHQMDNIGAWHSGVAFGALRCEPASRIAFRLCLRRWAQRIAFKELCLGARTPGRAAPHGSRSRVSSVTVMGIAEPWFRGCSASSPRFSATSAAGRST
jgi:hypothetical protein